MAVFYPFTKNPSRILASYWAWVPWEAFARAPGVPFPSDGPQAGRKGLGRALCARTGSNGRPNASSPPKVRRRKAAFRLACSTDRPGSVTKTPCDRDPDRVQNPALQSGNRPERLSNGMKRPGRKVLTKPLSAGPGPSADWHFGISPAAGLLRASDTAPAACFLRTWSGAGKPAPQSAGLVA